MDQPDEFYMYQYKVTACQKKFYHSWSDCTCSHSGETARRRDPRIHTYSSTMCPHTKARVPCPDGDYCALSHSFYESWFHPERYKTVLCMFGDKCTRKACFFAHQPSELRAPASHLRREDLVQEARAMLSNSGAGSGRQHGGRAARASTASAASTHPDIAFGSHLAGALGPQEPAIGMLQVIYHPTMSQGDVQPRTAMSMLTDALPSKGMGMPMYTQDMMRGTRGSRPTGVYRPLPGSEPSMPMATQMLTHPLSQQMPVQPMQMQMQMQMPSHPGSAIGMLMRGMAVSSQAGPFSTSQYVADMQGVPMLVQPQCMQVSVNAQGNISPLQDWGMEAVRLQAPSQHVMLTANNHVDAMLVGQASPFGGAEASMPMHNVQGAVAMAPAMQPSGGQMLLVTPHQPQQMLLQQQQQVYQMHPQQTLSPVLLQQHNQHQAAMQHALQPTEAEASTAHQAASSHQAPTQQPSRQHSVGNAAAAVPVPPALPTQPAAQMLLRHSSVQAGEGCSHSMLPMLQETSMTSSTGDFTSVGHFSTSSEQLSVAAPGAGSARAMRPSFEQLASASKPGPGSSPAAHSHGAQSHGQRMLQAPTAGEDYARMVHVLAAAGGRASGGYELMQGSAASYAKHMHMQPHLRPQHAPRSSHSSGCSPLHMLGPMSLSEGGVRPRSAASGSARPSMPAVPHPSSGDHTHMMMMMMMMGGHTGPVDATQVRPHGIPRGASHCASHALSMNTSKAGPSGLSGASSMHGMGMMQHTHMGLSGQHSALSGQPGPSGLYTGLGHAASAGTNLHAPSCALEMQESMLPGGMQTGTAGQSGQPPSQQQMLAMQLASDDQQTQQLMAALNALHLHQHQQTQQGQVVQPTTDRPSMHMGQTPGMQMGQMAGMLLGNPPSGTRTSAAGSMSQSGEGAAVNQVAANTNPFDMAALLDLLSRNSTEQ